MSKIVYMKKLAFGLLLMICVLRINGQCEEDFTPQGFIDFLDTNGYEHSLYEYLLAGKIVVADFYLLTCGSCMSSAPCIEEIYQDYGQNTGEVIVLAFDVGEGDSTDELAEEWAQEHGMPNVPNFSQMGGEQDTEGFWGEFYFSCGQNGGFAQTYIITGDFCCGDPSALNYETGCYAYCGDNTCCIYEEGEAALTSGVSYVHQGGVVNCNEIRNHLDNLLIEIMDLGDHINQPKKLINTINLFGQSIVSQSNNILFNVYDDGSVEKNYIIK